MDPCGSGSWLYFSVTKSFIIFIQLGKEDSLGDGGAQPAPPTPAPGVGAGGTPPPSHLHNKLYGWSSVSDPRIPDNCLSPDTDSDPRLSRIPI